MADRAVNVVCEADDKNKDMIARQLALLQDASELETLVAISCVDVDSGDDVTVIAVITKDSGEELVGYAPIGMLLAPDDDRLQKVTPKLAHYVMPDGDKDVTH